MLRNWIIGAQNKHHHRSAISHHPGILPPLVTSKLIDKTAYTDTVVFLWNDCGSVPARLSYIQHCVDIELKLLKPWMLAPLFALSFWTWGAETQLSYPSFCFLLISIGEFTITTEIYTHHGWDFWLQSACHLRQVIEGITSQLTGTRVATEYAYSLFFSTTKHTVEVVEGFNKYKWVSTWSCRKFAPNHPKLIDWLQQRWGTCKDSEPNLVPREF